MSNRKGWIDFLKGIAIFLVLLEHSILRSNLDIIHSWFYIGQAVPIFLLITAYLATIKLENVTAKEYFRVDSFLKMFKRVIKPFIVVQFISIIILLLTNQFDIKKLYFAGGFGPGSYYPFIYVQAWILLPFLVFILNKLNTTKATILVILISILAEVIYIIFNPYLVPYRLFVGRYIFLLFLGCMWRKNVIPKFFYFLAIPSAILVFLEFHHYFTNSNLVYNTIWTGYHWWAYFYTLVFFSLLIYIYKRVSEFSLTSKIKKLGEASYEIFMVQMLIFGFIKEDIIFSRINIDHYAESLLISFAVVVFNIFVSIKLGLFIYNRLNK